MQLTDRPTDPPGSVGAALRFAAVDEHVSVRRGRRGLPGVNRLARAVGQPQDHERAAPDAARVRVRHAQAQS